VPTDLPAVSERKREAQAQTKADIMMVVSVWVIVCLFTLVLVLLLADQGFSNSTTECECLFKASTQDILCRILKKKKLTAMQQKIVWNVWIRCDSRMVRQSIVLVFTVGAIP